MSADGKPLRRGRARRGPTYRSLDKDLSCLHPIDEAVHARVDRASRTRNLARAAQTVLDALGKKRRLWFDYEQAQGLVTSRREAAYFDIGVEYGIAAARAHGFGAPSKTVRALAQRMVQELTRAGVGRPQAHEAALVAAWALLGRSV